MSVAHLLHTYLLKNIDISTIFAAQILSSRPKNGKFRQKFAVFSYIRLRRVISLRSVIRLMPGDIRFASFCG